MRTTIDIDDALLAEAMRVTGLPTERATVEEALRTLVRAAGREAGARALADLAGSDPGLEPVPRRRSGPD